jgi:hypothetical protein
MWERRHLLNAPFICTLYTFTVLLDSGYDSVVEQNYVCEILIISELVSN